MSDNKTDKPTQRREQVNRGRRTSWIVKIGAVVVVVIAAFVYGGFWLAHRLTHVSSNDARVAAHVITVSSRLAGRVSAFDLRRGDHLDKNETVAQLYSKPDRLKLGRMQAELAAKTAALDTEQASVRLAKKRTASGVAQSKAMLKADQASLASAKARMKRARDEAQRTARLYRANSVSKQKRNATRYTAQARKAEVQAAKRQVEFDKVALANARTGLLTNPPMNLPSPKVAKAKIKRLRDQRAAALAALKHQRNRVDDLRVASPVGGVVDKRFINPQEYVSAGQPIVMMHRPDKVWILAKIKETKVHSLDVGQPVDIHVDAWPDTDFSGTVEVIGQAATNQFALLPPPNPSGNFTKITQRIPVRIAIDKGPKKKLSPGMMVEVDIDVSGDGNNRAAA